MIGVFDSGIGGLTVVRELRRFLPGKALVYFGDTARTPYGNKSAETVRRFAVEDAAYVLGQGATTLVVACNTMSAVAVDAIRQRFPSVPLFEVIAPAVDAVAARRAKRIGVIGTRATIGSGVYGQRIRERLPKAKVIERACPLLVPLVEEGMFDAAETKRVIRRYLEPLKHQTVDTLVLGCTHYPFLKDAISHKMGKSCAVIDSASVTAKAVAAQAGKLADGPLTLHFSDLSPHTEELARAWVPEADAINHVPVERVERGG
ncbi:MAG: glutamate racemase [Candidatus Kerfeldbacteria bacterium]|nr:glutamate racemase [Candidatus Kerfeldbacteria bacterium]